MRTVDTSRYVRIRVEIVLEIDDENAVTEAALSRIADDAALPAAERAHAESTVAEDTAEALAYLVDPSDLVGEVPGVELQQASWTSERIDYDPEAPEWDLDEDDDGDFYTGDGPGRMNDEADEAEEAGEGEEAREEVGEEVGEEDEERDVERAEEATR